MSSTGLGPWTLLVIGGVFEMVWALGFKYVKGDAPWWMHAGVYAALIASMVLLIEAMKHLPAGTSYAVWTGVGTIGVAVLGILVFKEPATIGRVLFLGLIVVGILGLRLTSDG
jgi:quaternary ammonium compound-resistance protein SugE